MKKLLMLLALAAGISAMSSTQAAAPNAAAPSDAVDIRKARACKALLNEMDRSPDADNWFNRMRSWPCMRRG